ncbi:enoyl-CoA hydratase-related protein [Streptomyces sp. bgisy027]|uniref:enoyl-CoA hydratase-related protein n=1 Tax=unclassified Streptomyces TaxID=2593676 RepID=UPI003D7437EB
MPKPVAAAANGVAAGVGLSPVPACDFRIAAASATLPTAFAGIALSWDAGISWTLPRIAGRATALDLLLRP